MSWLCRLRQHLFWSMCTTLKAAGAAPELTAGSSGSLSYLASGWWVPPQGQLSDKCCNH